MERGSTQDWSAGDAPDARDGDSPFLVVNLRSSTAPRGLPGAGGGVPVIVIGAAEDCDASLADVIVADERGVPGLARTITANPRAAAVTVQLLRLVERLPLAEAQLAESLAYGLLQGGEEHARWLAARQPAPELPPGNVALDRKDSLLTVTLERGAARNAIDRPMRDALREAFELAAIDDTITQVRLRGAGKAFCIGADLAEFGTTRDPVRAHEIRMATLPAHVLARCADKLHVHVQGACIGAGLEMAAYAARITATRDAWFQLPELAMGLLPGAGGCVSVTRRIGRHRAGWMMLSGQRVNARTALGWGLVDAIVDDAPTGDHQPDVA